MIKTCSKCGENKNIELFNRDKSSKDGHRSNCKECSKKYREENKSIFDEYRLKTKEKRKEYDKNRYWNNVEENRKEKSIYYEQNKEKVKKKSKEYYKNNRVRKIQYQKMYTQKNREKINKKISEKRKNNPLFRLITNIRNLVNKSFYNNGYSKTSSTKEILGCSFEEFKLYLESKFEPWMNWDNRGLYNGQLNNGWDIDHIIPIESASSNEEVVKLNHFTNLQPLCSKVNRDIKKNNIEYGII